MVFASKRGNLESNRFILESKSLFAGNLCAETYKTALLHKEAALFHSFLSKIGLSLCHLIIWNQGFLIGNELLPI